MNQNIKSFEEFKKMYTSDEFKELLKRANKVKKLYRKFVIITLIWGIPAIFFMILAPLLGLGIMAVGIILEIIIFGRKNIVTYSNFYRTEIPFLISKLSGIELNIAEIAQKEYFNIENEEAPGLLEQVKNLKKNMKVATEFDKKQNARIDKVNKLNAKQFETSKIVDADEYYTSNIARFKHTNTDTTIDFYYVTAMKVEKVQRTRKRENAENYSEEDRYITYTERKEKVLTSGVVFTFENLYNINLKDFRILIKDDDTLLSRLTENTIDNLKENKNEIKFNRIDLNKSFDFYAFSDDKSKDVKVEALEIVTPVVEDLIAYIRKKYGRFNMAINDQKIDIELLDTSLIGGNKKQYKSIILKPKIFSNKDLRISYLYRFYELIEIQKLILKYLNCYPEKYLITDEDVIGLKEAVESKNLSDYEMDKSVEETFKEIIQGGI